MPGCMDLTGSKGRVASTGEYLRHIFFTTTEDAVDGSPLGIVVWDSARQGVRLVGLGVFAHGGGRRSLTANFREYGALILRGIRSAATRLGGALTASASAPCMSTRAIRINPSIASRCASGRSGRNGRNTTGGKHGRILDFYSN